MNCFVRTIFSLCLLSCASAGIACDVALEKVVGRGWTLADSEGQKVIELSVWARGADVGYTAALYKNKIIRFRGKGVYANAGCVERVVSDEQFRQVMQLFDDEEFFAQPETSGGSIGCACNLIEAAIDGRKHLSRFGPGAVAPLTALWGGLHQEFELGKLTCPHGDEPNREEKCHRYEVEFGKLMGMFRALGKRQSKPE